MKNVIESTGTVVITIGEIPELKVDKDLQIENLQDANEKLESFLTKYRNTVVTTENLKDWEKDSRSLGGLATKLTKVRTTAKNEFMQKIEPFENAIKSMVEKINSAKVGIDAQTKVFEEERVALAREFFESEAKTLSEQMGVSNDYFELLFEIDTKWLNRGAKEKDVIEAIVAKMNVIKAEQNKEEERKRLIKEKEELIAFECESVSKQLNLINPINTFDVSFTDQASLIDIKKGIMEFAEERKKQEDAVAEAAEQKQLEKEQNERERLEQELTENVEAEETKQFIEESKQEEFEETERELEFNFEDVFEQEETEIFAMISIGKYGKAYCFKTISGLAVGDYVVCDTKNGYVIGQVSRFTTAVEETKYATKYAFQKVVYPEYLGGTEDDK